PLLLDLLADHRDLEAHLTHRAQTHAGTSLALPFNETLIDQLAHGAVHGRTGGAIFHRQLLLVWHGTARRPCPVQDPLQNIRLDVSIRHFTTSSAHGTHSLPGWQAEA